MKVFIDPGHGGQHPGAVNASSGRKEKDATLQIGLKLRDRLNRMGFVTLMSRECDEHVELSERCRMANKWCADCFVSIHLNAPGQTSGAETWYYVSAKAKTRELARLVQRALIASTGARDRGVKTTESFTTCKRTYMPSIVVECGFITNDKESEKCFSPSYQDAIVNGIANGLLQWKQWHEG